MAVIPTIERKYLPNCTYLNIAGNNLSDAAFVQLCASLKEMHVNSIHTMDIQDNNLSDEALKALIDVLSQMTSLKEVHFDGNPQMNPTWKNKLKIRLKKNEMTHVEGSKGRFETDMSKVPTRDIYWLIL